MLKGFLDSVGHAGPEGRARRLRRSRCPLPPEPCRDPRPDRRAVAPRRASSSKSGSTCAAKWRSSSCADVHGIRQLSPGHDGAVQGHVRRGALPRRHRRDRRPTKPNDSDERSPTSSSAVGVLAIEFFVSDRGLFVNEIALRPHNTGHWTIEGARDEPVRESSSRGQWAVPRFDRAVVRAAVHGERRRRRRTRFDRAARASRPARTCTTTASRGVRAENSATSPSSATMRARRT